MFFTPKRLTMLIVSIALFMDVLDTNVINTAVPAMANTFHVSPIDIKIALISYLLSLAIFIPMSGWAADKYGIKKIFIGSLAFFTVCSVLCGCASSLMFLVVARFFQGIGAAFMISLGRLILARTFKRHELVEAMNTVVIVVSFAVMVGPFIGGLIVHYWSWPWIFWVNIPVGIFVVLLASFSLQEIGIKNIRPFDFLGFVLFGGSLAIFAFSLSELSESHVNIESACMRMLIGLTMLIAYIFHAKRKRYPVINIALFRIRTFRISVFGNICARLGFAGIPFLLPLLQQVGFGFSPQLSGLLLMPSAFGIIVSKLMAVKILRKTGYRQFLLVNTILVGVVLWSFQTITIKTPIPVIALFTFIYGVFVSAQYTGMNSLALSDIKDEELSASTSITSTIQILAQSLGVATGAILLRIYSGYFSKATVLSPADFHYAFMSLGVITALSAVIFLGLKPGDGKQMLLKSV
jgi:EmrB/QacA subfamily drug resistance transporter